MRERTYGVSPERYAEMLDDQGGVCAICSKPPNGRDLFVDHNHTTGEVRGLLCVNCNTALGMFYESPELMARATEYLASFN